MRLWIKSRHGVSALCVVVAVVAAVSVATAGPSSEVTPDEWPEVAWPLERDPDIERRIDALLASMTIERKVGQIVQADIGSVTPDDVRRYGLGSILAGGNSSPGGKYNAAPSEWLALADAFYEAAMEAGDPAIPILFGIDAVHGHNNVVGATIFPHNIGLGAARNPELVREIARITAIETRTTGMEWTFAPSIAVPRDPRWGRTYEGYGESPDLVAEYSAAVVEGLQGRVGDDDFLGPHRVAATAKHFIGDGGTVDGIDQGDARMSEAELRDIHAAGYPPAIAAGTQSVMASFNSFNGEKLHGHHGLLTGVLKERMNFDGLLVGDWNGHGQVAGCTSEDCPRAVNAGIDMLMAPDSWRGFFDNAVRQVRDGEIPMERLDDAVRRVLRVKFRLGLFEVGKPSARPLAGEFERLGAPEHRAVARRAVRESLVLLKNAGGLLPLDPGRHVLVAGDGADDIGKQSGGWTLTWQGSGTMRDDFPNAETVWEGIRAQVEAAGGRAELSVDGEYGDRPDMAVVVFGEDPYAEFQGDLPNLRYKPGDDSDLELLRRLAVDDIPVVAVYLGGRPLWLNREINASDAFVAAWLPGSEGGGVADVLLRDADGGVRHDFSGRLSFSWPRTAGQYDLNVGQAGYDPLFAYGFGLTYADTGDLAPLPEEPGVADAAIPSGMWFARGEAGNNLDLRLIGADGVAVPAGGPRAESADGHLALAAIDHRAQEDARLLRWTGPARLELAADPPLDLERETNGDVLLTMTVRVDALPEGEVTLLAVCGGDCRGELPIGAWLAELPRGEWLRAGVPLKCLRFAGADMARLQVPFALRSGPGLVLGFSDIAPGTEVDWRHRCRETP